PIEPNNKALNSSASSAPRNSIKRPCDSNIQPSSALKKAKCTDSSSSASSEDDGSDDVPLARRLTVGEPSKRKPSAKDIVTKKKKSPSSSKDNQKVVKRKTKKLMRNSRSSKATKVREVSGGGKKWSTLVHNGVIFPPPYKPHGVKMLYNGKPVDLTPEQ
uniref:DNA topoisomerase I DNA binding eukaryotic-type domain-containing protein n=2 Tax=Aegilops tauschii TaxID=37682 RepID=A0A453D542_AEGTS